jgi:hypothetical protein
MPFGEPVTPSTRLERVPIPAPRPPGRFRVGRWWLLAEGVLVVQLAGVAIAEQALHPEHTAGGFPLRGLMLTRVDRPGNESALRRRIRHVRERAVHRAPTGDRSP